MQPLSLLSFKSLALAGIAAATLGTGAVAASAATTEDDTNFGQQVREEVLVCRASVARTDQHGIGHCMSAWVTAHNPGHTDATKTAKTDQASGDAVETPNPKVSPKAEAAESETENASDLVKTAKPAEHGRKGR